MAQINRRRALKTLGWCGASLVLPSWRTQGKEVSHVVSLSFDDGFKASSIKTAEIYEKFNLSACINVIATGHHQDFKIPDEYQVTEKGDFMLWNELQSRGHEIMPHGYAHINHTKVPLADAIGLVTKCLDYFTLRLHGFESCKAVYNLPYNASYPELEAWLLTKVRAIRTSGSAINKFPHSSQARLTCSASGPGNTEAHLDAEIEKLLKMPQGWLIYNAHGLDGEGWGPMRASYLESLLDRLLRIDTVAVLPVGVTLSSLAK